MAQRLQASEAKVVTTTQTSSTARTRIPDARDRGEARSRGAERRACRSVAPRDELVADYPGELPAAELESETPYLLTYTSGTTGTPKGVVHVQGGFSVSIAREVCLPGGRGPATHPFVTDMGWIMGPWTVVGGRAWAHARLRGGRAGLAGAGPAVEADRAERVSVLGISPTLDARAASRTASRGATSVAAHDRHHRRALESRAVPLALRAGRRRALPDHQLLGRDRGRRLLPLADAAIPIKACSLGGPALGMAMDVVDSDGKLGRAARSASSSAGSRSRG